MTSRCVCDILAVSWFEALILFHREGQPQLRIAVLLWCIVTGWEQSNYPVKLNSPNKSCFTSRAAGRRWRKQAGTYRRGNTWKIRTCTVHSTHAWKRKEKGQTVFWLSPLTHMQTSWDPPLTHMLPASTAFIHEALQTCSCHEAAYVEKKFLHCVLQNIRHIKVNHRGSAAPWFSAV